MTRAVLLTLVALILWAPSTSAQSSVADLERALAAAVKEKETLVGAREAKVADASVLATEIDLAKRSASAPHAGSDLQDLLRRFDRMVAELDRLQSQIESVKRRIERMRVAFDRAATEAASKLSTSGDAVRRLVAFGEIESARRRVDALEPKPNSVRPALSITLQPKDLPSDIERKIGLVEVERARMGQELARLDRELAVIATRLTLTKQLLADLRESSAPSTEQALVGREADTLANARRELERQQQRLEQQRAPLVQTDDLLRQRVADFKRRLGQLTARPGDQ